MIAPMAGIDIVPGHHLIVWKVAGFTLHGDTIISSVLAGALLVGLGFFMRRRLSVRQPGGVQLFFETVTEYVEKQVEDSMGVKSAPFVVPMAFCLFLFILFANWIALIPTKEYVPPPASDPNLTYALAFLVIVTMHVVGIRRQGLGYYKHIFEKPRVLFPLRIIEELIKPFTLALRLFGNIFAGVIMLALIAALPAFILWLPELLWKLFDAFIGLIQAFIFALLTVLYMSSIAPHGDNHSAEKKEKKPHQEAAH
ncbi:MAG: F0F1 ATP synthase subunit A [Jatrophihabitans sp.]